MPKATPSIPNFTGGELSPYLYGRTDFAKWESGCRQLLNAIVYAHGGATRRPGFRFVAECGTSADSVKLVPFIFSVEQAYVLEFGNQYMRVFMDQGQVVTGGGTPYEIATPFTPADLASIKYTQSADVMYLANPNYDPQRLTRTGHTAWTIGTVVFGAQVNAPTGPAAAGAAGAIPQSYQITSLTAEGYESVGSTPANAVALQASAANPVTVTWTGATGADEYRIYKANDNSGIYGLLGRATGGTFIDRGQTVSLGDCVPAAQGPFAAADDKPRAVCFYEQRLCWAGTNNKPMSVFLSKTGDYENMDRSSPPRDDDACEFALNSDQINVIRAVIPGQNLSIFTGGSEWSMSGSGNDPITPTSVAARVQARNGSADIQPVVVGNVPLFVDRTQRRVHEFIYTYEQDGYTAPDLSLLAEHMTRDSRIVDWAWAQNPHNILWCVRDDGVLVAMTYMREQEVWAWHRHTTDGFFESVAVIPGEDRDEVWVSVRREIGGVDRRYIELLEGDFCPSALGGAPDTLDAFFVDCGLTYDNGVAITAISTGNPVTVVAAGHGMTVGDDFRIYDAGGMAEINGDKYYVRTVTGGTFTVSNLAGDALDGTLFTPYTAGGDVYELVTTISGLDHLAGKTVALLGDGAVLPEQPVTTGGTVVMSKSAGIVQIGLPYETVIEPMLPNYGVADGTAQGRVKKIIGVTVRMDRTLGLSAGSDDDTMDPFIFLSPADPLGRPEPIFTGDKFLTWPGGWDTDGRMLFKSGYPLPMTLISLIYRIDTTGR